MPDDSDVLVVTDLQNDFCPEGALAVPEGDSIIPAINALVHRFPHVVLTQDWHPPDHSSFASSHPGRKPFDTITMPYGPQVLWPDHCVQDTRGADFHRALIAPRAELIIRKGFHRDIDSYSVFFENDRRTATGFGGYLRERGLRRVFLCGLATDFCVRYSAEDAHMLHFEVAVITDASRAIDTAGSLAAAYDSFARNEIPLLLSSQIR
ncbi:MAG: bifunctional nicotinamidase/pyrazinamidase [Gemmatimonas sp.]